MGAVVDDTNANGPVDVAFEEVDQHFLPDAGNVLDSPARSGAGTGDPHPGG